MKLIIDLDVGGLFVGRQNPTCTQIFYDVIPTLLNLPLRPYMMHVMKIDTLEYRSDINY